MGGYGSGRWRDHTKAETVEASLKIDAADLTRKGIVPKVEGVNSGGLAWTTAAGEERASVLFTVDTRPPTPHLSLSYRARGEPVVCRVLLVSTRPPLGGIRWLFLCPSGCGRRAAKLFLPPSAHRFACRECHGLTYTSAQEHDARVDRILRGELVLPPYGTGSTRAKLAALALGLKARRIEWERLTKAGTHRGR